MQGAFTRRVTGGIFGMEENRLDGYTLVWEENFDCDGSPCEKDWSLEVGERWANNE